LGVKSIRTRALKASYSNLFLLHCKGYLLSVQDIKYVKKNKEEKCPYPPYTCKENRRVIFVLPILMVAGSSRPTIFDGRMHRVNWLHCHAYTICKTTSIMDQITIKIPSPKCRPYWCFIEFIDWRDSQSYWYFRPLL
jgi:hypothetical protein